MNIFSRRPDGYLPLPFGGPAKGNTAARSRMWIIIVAAILASIIFIGSFSSVASDHFNAHSVSSVPYNIFSGKSNMANGLGNHRSGSMKGKPSKESMCLFDTSSLAQYNLTGSITYAKRYVRQRPFEEGPYSKLHETSHIEEIGEGLFKHVEGIDLVNSGLQRSMIEDRNAENGVNPSTGESDKGELRASSQNTRMRATTENVSGAKVNLKHCYDETLTLYTKQNHRPVDARHLMFGVASTAERLVELAPTMATWLAHTGARLLAIVPDGAFVPKLQETFEELGIDAVVLLSNEDYLKNYFKLVEAFYIHADDETRWVTFIDDDTHYFSLRRFAELLGKYDARKEYYVGGVSEDFRQMRGWGIYAFGGAGISLSMPLLEKLHWNYPHCQGFLSPDPGTPGDLRLARCIYYHTNTKLTMEHDIHQVDLLGDTAGIMEGPRPPINWHHYKSWSPHDVLRTSKAGKLCGDSCLFQRWKFTRPVAGYAFTTLHLGFSIVRYAVGVFPDMARTERTWANLPESIFDHSLSPLRDPMIEGMDRFTYRLEGSGDEPDGTFRQTYIRRATSETEMDSVLELFWS